MEVLVGTPSNDPYTKTLGYVGVLMTEGSLAEYNRAMMVYGGQQKHNVAHVTVCGWNGKGFDSYTEARLAFDLITEDHQLYPDGKTYYDKDVFPNKK